MNQIINMIIRQVTNQLIRRGVNAGFDRLSRRGQPEDAGQAQRPLTPEEKRARQQERQARQQAKRAKQSLKAMRKVTRF